MFLTYVLSSSSSIWVSLRILLFFVHFNLRNYTLNVLSLNIRNMVWSTNSWSFTWGRLISSFSCLFQSRFSFYLLFLITRIVAFCSLFWLFQTRFLIIRIFVWTRIITAAIIFSGKRIRPWSNTNAFFNINLIVKLLHLFMHVSFFICLYLLDLFLYNIDTCYNTLYIFNLLSNFFDMLTYIFSLMGHMIKQLFFSRVRVICYNFYHYFFEWIYFRVFFFIIFHYVLFVLII